MLFLLLVMPYSAWQPAHPSSQLKDLWDDSLVSHAEVSCPFLSMPPVLCIFLIITLPDEGFTASLDLRYTTLNPHGTKTMSPIRTANLYMVPDTWGCEDFWKWGLQRYFKVLYSSTIRSALSVGLKMWICSNVIDKFGNLSITQNSQLLMCNYLWKTLDESKTLYPNEWSWVETYNTHTHNPQTPTNYISSACYETHSPTSGVIITFPLSSGKSSTTSQLNSQGATLLMPISTSKPGLFQGKFYTL